jgi:putative transposase
MKKLHIKSALDKFEIIRPHLEDDISLPNIAKDKLIGLRTLHTWVKNYRENGLKGLERKIRSDKGQQQKITKELAELVEALVLKKPPISLAAIHRKVVKVAKQKGLVEPTYRVVWLTAKQIDPALILLAGLAGAFAQKVTVSNVLTDSKA